MNTVKLAIEVDSTVGTVDTELPIRRHLKVMDDSFERPSATQLAEMEKLVAAAMEQGALGLSSQVMMPPGSLATTDDIVQLCKVVA